MLTFDPLSTFNTGFAVANYLIVIGVLTVVAAITFFAMSLASYGMQGPAIFVRRIGDFFRDWFGTSFRRIAAVANLTRLEAQRRKVLYVFVIFMILYLFAGWFTTGVGNDADMALEIYVAFVLRTISWLVLPVVLFLSCWGLPEDIRLRSVHTVVTKPIRKHEIVLGRILGYSGVGLFIVAIMTVVGYVWIIRLLPPAARVQLEAKVPIYGPLAFRDREGRVTNSGINVGDENEFRSFIEGNTKARAIWDFYNPAWKDLHDRDVLTIGGKIEPGDVFQLSLGGSKLAVTAKSSDPQGVAADIVAAWSQADAATHKPFTEVAVAQRGNTLELTPKAAGASLAVETSVSPAKRGGPVLAEFHTEPVKLDCRFQAFRTWKGNIERGLLCQFMVAKEYGVLTLPERIPQGTLKLKSVEVKLAAGTPETATAAIAAALAGANPKTHLEYTRIVPELQPAASGGGARTVFLRTGPSDLLASMEVTGIPGVKYQFFRQEAATSPFEIREFRRNEYLLPRALTDKDGKVVDLYRDLLDEGRLRVEARCLSGGQLLGMARPDLIVRLPSRTFLETYLKACLGIALMMGVIVVLGVCSSTFVKGPISLMLTMFFLGLGWIVRPFLDFMAKGKGTGGGAIEGAYRVMYHLNPNTNIEATPAMNIVKFIDAPLNGTIWALRYIVPDFRMFSMDEYVAKSIDIPWQTAILPCVLIAVGVAVPWIVLGHFSLMVRELEHK